METGFLMSIKEIYRLVRRKIGTLPFWWGYIAIALVLIAGAGLYIWFYGLRQRVETKPIAVASAGSADNLWFLRDGTLVGSQHSWPGYVTVSTWAPDGNVLVRKNRQSFDISGFPALIKARAAEDDRGRRDPSLPLRQSLPESFTIAPDGSRVALLLYGYVCVYNGVRTQIVDTLTSDPFDSGDPVRAVAFTDNGRLALARTGGSVEFHNPDLLSDSPTIAQTKLDKPSILKPYGNLLVVVSTVNAAAVVLDVRSLAREVKPHAYPLGLGDQLVLAVSNTGRLAVGTGSNKVYLTPRTGDGDASIELSAYGDVEILSFYDEDRVLAGGAFQDVYLLSQRELPERIATVGSGVNALAVHSDKIAYAGVDGVFLLSHHARLQLNTGGKIAVYICLALLAGLGLILSFDVKTRRKAAMAEEKKSEEPPALRLPAELPPDLIEACAAGDCVLYAGAGLSAQSGMPIWKNFVHDLLNWAVENGYVDETEANSFHAAVDSGDSDPVADSIISKLKTPEQLASLNSYLRSVFMRSVSPSQAHLLLRQIKFSAVLTTNFDNLLERTYQDLPTKPDVYTPKDAERLLTSLTKRDNFILKLYGTLDDTATVMVAPAQYESAITNNRVFSRFMQTLFFSRTLLFIGASLEGIEAYLRGISLPRDIGRKHYALVDVVGNAWRAKADLLERRYGIKVLAYTPGSDYAELTGFLKRLAARVSSQTSGKDVRQATSRLKKVTLENIGPFDHMSVVFDGQMQVLLGDNGVGKSTILKAVALALCGEEAQPYADRLLASGRSHAKIILETDNKTSYITEIIRNSQTRAVEIISHTARPLEAEGWLAVAFPPLRTTSWTPPKGPDADKKSVSRPVADDVLPLLKGDVDPRLDNLKQWIVNLDYASIRKDSGNKGSDDNYRKLIDKVFEVISTVTEKMALQFVAVETGTNKVIVKTDNGIEMPLEALSQGTISLIGWLGVLLQRLYEVYDQDEDPTKRFALVLMDEIDAHMHPLWQRTLVNNLKEIFPNVQFIATTHSPLLIRGMPFQQVTRFVREGGKVTMPRLEPDMTFGYTDQLLTSMLFDLPAELDDTTERHKKRYYELFQKQDRTGFEAEYEFLKQELMIRIPPRSATYQEKHEEQLKQASMLDQIAERLKQVSPDGGRVLKERADGLRSGIERRYEE